MPIMIDQTRIDDLVARPTESLNVEIKRWISPDEPEGIAKIARAALAIRNRNGGFLIIGFDDKTRLPDVGNEPRDVRAAFQIDKIQGIVSRYSYELFEVAVGFGERDGVQHPVVVVPEGVRVPIAAKADLKDSKGKLLVRLGDVYFRTLGSNGTVSTAAARPSDWRDIVEICFENREADIGRFLRRHLGDRDLGALLSQFSTATVLKPMPTLRDRAEALLNDGEKRYLGALSKRKLGAEKMKELDAGTWGTALVVDPPRTDAVADKQFLSSFAVANPNYTGWPIWLDSRGFIDSTAHPKVVDKGWEALIISLEGWSRHVDFMRMDPKGNFYLHRLFQDDFSDKVERGNALDPTLVVLRTAEAIAVGLTVVKGIGWSVQETTLGFGFRWTKLSGRELSSWANPLVGVLPNHIAEDDSAESFVELPLDTPVSAIAPYVGQVVNDLFSAFAGYQMQQEAIEEWVKRLIERRL
jgi:hypothetical protein